MNAWRCCTDRPCTECGYPAPVRLALQFKGAGRIELCPSCEAFHRQELARRAELPTDGDRS